MEMENKTKGKGETGGANEKVKHDSNPTFQSVIKALNSL